MASARKRSPSTLSAPKPASTAKRRPFLDTGYQIETWGKYVRSESPAELSMGVDLSGGEDWQAATVAWHPWDEKEEESWVHTQVVVRAEGGMLTLFLKGYHPYAAQGGATLFDDVRVTDLGP